MRPATRRLSSSSEDEAEAPQQLEEEPSYLRPSSRSVSAPRDARVRALCAEVGRLQELLRSAESRQQRSRDAADAADARATAAERSAGQAAFSLRQATAELAHARAAAQQDASRWLAERDALKARLADAERRAARAEAAASERPARPAERPAAGPAHPPRPPSPGEGALQGAQREVRRLAGEVAALRELEARRGEAAAEARAEVRRRAPRWAGAPARFDERFDDRFDGRFEEAQDERSQLSSRGREGESALSSPRRLSPSPVRNAESEALRAELSAARAAAREAQEGAAALRARLAAQGREIAAALALVAGSRSVQGSPASARLATPG